MAAAKIAQLIEDEIEPYKARIKQLEEDLASVQAAVQSMEQHMRENCCDKKVYEDVTKDKEELERVIGVLRQELEDAKKDLDKEKNMDIKKYQRSIESIKQKEEENAQLVTAAQQKDEQISSLTEQLTQKNQENQMLAEKAARGNKDADEMKKKYDKKMGECATLREKIEGLQKEIQKKQEQYDHVSAELHKSKSIIAKQMAKINKIHELEQMMECYLGTKRLKTGEDKADVVASKGSMTEDDFLQIDALTVDPIHDDDVPSMLQEGEQIHRMTFDDDD